MRESTVVRTEAVCGNMYRQCVGERGSAWKYGTRWEYVVYVQVVCGSQWRSQGGARGAIAPPFFKNNVIKTFVIDVR